MVIINRTTAQAFRHLCLNTQARFITGRLDVGPLRGGATSLTSFRPNWTRQPRMPAPIAALVRALEHAATADEAIRAALNTIREAFGWELGRIDRSERKSKSFRRPSSRDRWLRKSEAPRGGQVSRGGRTCGGAWKARDLIFIPDFGAMSGPGYIRAPIFKKHGIRSAMCFPIMIDGKVIGTMDYFTTEIARPVGRAQRGIAKHRPAGFQHHPCPQVGRQGRGGRGGCPGGTRTYSRRSERYGQPRRRSRLPWIPCASRSAGLMEPTGHTILSENVLKFMQESGSVNEEFRRVTTEARFQRGRGPLGPYLEDR